jgi:hypothetical protein
MYELASATPLQIGGGGFLYWAVVFFVLAIVAAAVGARGVAGVSMEIRADLHRPRGDRTPVVASSSAAAGVVSITSSPDQQRLADLECRL